MMGHVAPKTKVAIGICFMLMLILLSGPAHGVDRYWVTTGTEWTQAANWNPLGVPITGDNVFLTFSDDYYRKINYYQPTVAETFGTFTMDQKWVGTLTFFQGYNDYTFPLAAEEEIIGKSGKAVYKHTRGSNTVTANMFLGSNAGSSGTYQLSGTGTVSSSRTYVGESGTGLFQQTGGGNEVQTLYLGYGATGKGSYELSDAGQLEVVNLNVGYYGTGTFKQQGAVTVCSNMTLGRKSGSSGAYEMSNLGYTGPGLTTEFCTVGVEGAGSFTQSGGSHLVTGNLTLGYSTGGSGVYTLKGGSLTARGITINPSGTLIQEGGSISVDYPRFINNGHFIYKSGALTGVLQNNGVATFLGQFHCNYDLQNHGQVNLPVGGEIVFQGSSFYYNNGDINLQGGILSGTDVNVQNHGNIRGFGVIRTNVLVNHLSLVQDGGDLRLNISPYTVDENNFPSSYTENRGSVELQVGRALILEAPFFNYYSMKLNGAAVKGDILENYGILEGPGTITNKFFNTGTLRISGGPMKIDGNIENRGQIFLTSAQASLAGGAIYNERGAYIRGSGEVFNFITNEGVIEASGGTLTLHGGVINHTGIVSTEAGSVLTVGFSGSNHGLINLRGGTMFNPWGLENAYDGRLIGQGTIISNDPVRNFGKMVFASGVSQVIIGYEYFSKFTNKNGGWVEVDHGQVIFNGDFENEAGGTMKNTGGVFTFGGGFVNNGLYYSDPATQTFNDLSVGQPGVLVGATGDYFLIGNDFLNRSGNRSQWNTLRAELEFINGSDNRHLMLLAGADRGAVPLGFKNNFAWGVLDISQQFLELQDGNDLLGGAFYVGELLGADLRGDMVANILGHGFNIYYDPLLPGNEYLLGQRYAFLEGGYLAPVGYAATPLPGSLVLVLSGLLGLTGMGLRAGGRKD